MARSWIFNFSQQYDLKISPTGNAYGKVGGYFVSVFEKETLIIINFSYFAENNDRKKVNAAGLKMRENYTISALSGDISVSTQGAIIRLPNTPQAQSVVYKLITDYTELFKEFELLPEKKSEPVAPITASESSEVTTADELEVQKEEEITYTKTFEYNYTNPEFDSAMYGNLMPSAKKKIVRPSEIKYTGMVSVLRGFAGAFIGAFIGSIPWFICIGLNIVTEILFLTAILIAFCAGVGYRRARGASNFIITSIAIVSSVIGIELITMYLFFGNSLTDIDYMIVFVTGIYSSIGALMYLSRTG